MKFFFDKKVDNSQIINNSLVTKQTKCGLKCFLLRKGDIVRIRYYDSYKYLHFIEGQCVFIREKGDLKFFKLFNKKNRLFFYFFFESPLILSVFLRKS